MNFFKSIISDDPDPPNSESDPDSPRDPNDAADDDAWSFGGFVKSFATQSESVIETYRRDLQEFGSGLKKETEMLRESASRAVKDLPASLDVVLKSTASIITKESIGFSSDVEPESPGTNRNLNSGRYSRFEAELSAIQSDLNTFCMEPNDEDDYGKWKSGFELVDYRDEIDGLIGENGILEGVYGRVVPNAVDHETFWCRYLYRVDRLKQQESVRASIVKRAISNDEEELSWDVEDDDDDDNDEEDGNGSDRAGGLNVKGDNAASNGKSNAHVENVDGEKGNVVDVDEREGKSGKVAEVERGERVESEESVKDDGNDEKVVAGEKGESGINTDASVVSNQQSKVVAEEEDLGWDEIGDVGSGDENKTSAAALDGSPNKDDLRKRLSAAEEEEDDDDLNWDIEDDDEPVKA